MSRKTLLFADDSTTMREIMTKTFAAEDVDVLALSSGEAAIEKAKEVYPDVIIADAGMAGVSGYDLCNAIRSDPSLSGVPVIIMSGVSNPYDEKRGIEVGATEHVKKPFDTTKFIQKVLDLCEAGRASSATDVAVPTGKPKRSAPMVSQSISYDNVASPLAEPLIKDTIEFGKPFAKPERPKVAYSPSVPDPVLITETHDEPLELGNEPTGQGDFQVGTLAELAQMDKDGSQIPHHGQDEGLPLEESLATTDEPELAAQLEPELETVIEPEAPMVRAQVPRQMAMAAQKVTDAVLAQIEGLTAEQAEAIATLTSDVVERVVWEVVPDLAETIIKERIEALLKE